MTFIKNVNCKKNNKGAWCKDKRIKKSLSGIGARCCKIFEGKICEYQDLYPKPQFPSPSPTLAKCLYIYIVGN